MIEKTSAIEPGPATTQTIPPLASKDDLMQIGRAVLRPWTIESVAPEPTQAQADACRAAVRAAMRDRHGRPDRSRLEVAPTIERARDCMGCAAADGAPSLLVRVPASARITQAEDGWSGIARTAVPAGCRWMMSTGGGWCHLADLRTGRHCAILDRAWRADAKLMAGALRFGPDLDVRQGCVVAALGFAES